MVVATFAGHLRSRTGLQILKSDKDDAQAEQSNPHNAGPDDDNG
jgi:hypothetical protein